jgi:hypothetical protein
MGSFTLTIIDPEKGKNNANGLKLLTFILYYVYYNTFEDPLNNYLIKQLSNTKSEESSPSFNNTLQTMLLRINEIKKNKDDDSSSSSVYNSIIELLAEDMGKDLEDKLYSDLQATKLELAGRYTKEILKTINADVKEQVVSAQLLDTRYSSEINKLDRLLQHEDNMYIIMIMKIINNIVDIENANLKLQEEFDQSIIKEVKPQDSEPEPEPEPIVEPTPEPEPAQEPAQDLAQEPEPAQDLAQEPEPAQDLAQDPTQAQPEEEDPIRDEDYDSPSEANMDRMRRDMLRGYIKGAP